MTSASPPRPAPASIRPAGAESDALLDCLKDGVLRQREGRVVGANDALARLIGTPREGLIGARLTDLLVDSEGRPLCQIETRDAVCLRDASGGLRPMSLVRVSEELLLLVDRARERRLEEEVWRLSQRATSPPRAEAPLQGEVVGMIEHEIRTAVTVVRGYLRMLLSERRGTLNPEQWCFSREARRATERVLLLLDNLLDLSSTGEPLPVVRKPVYLHEVLRAALATARPLIEDAGLKVAIEFAAEDNAIHGDPDRLEQVFVNLIANAVAHTPEGSRLQIHTSTGQLGDEEVILIAFADEGPGIPDEDVQNIFQAFVQGHGSPGVASGGVGLGLAICRRIVEAHEGSIDAVPSLGYGLFRVTLPLGRRA